MSEHAHLHVDDDDGVRVVTIDRSEAKNAMTLAMRNALIDVVAAADASPTCTRW